MEFNLAEKLAIVKAIDKVILADKKVAKGEMVYLGQLMKLMNFDSEFVEEARKFSVKQADAILEGLSEAKKHSLAIMLHEMAYADGEMDKKEIEVLFSEFENAGIKIADADSNIPVFDLSDVYFKSSRQRRLDPNGNLIEERNENRAVKIEPHINGKDGVTVTIFKTGSLLNFWGNKVVMSPKHMEIKMLENTRSFLKGHRENGQEPKAPEELHSNYQLSIFHPSQEIEKIILHKRHQKIDIEYLK
ncbi:hypothetical protein GCM10023115_48990 [Pontixanthobacter gangjinensis]|uniref:tellurite resistance TerB family protein n=1 Tax=Christiangramia aestuarii TaxID=1028746 RepID=UPI00192E539B|nr:TerB family tellurite resistance protein [Christiangramia aestuarii]